MTDATVRLLLLPFAGGSAQTYRGLIAKLPPWIEPLAPELPGRGTRFRDKLLGTIEQLADDVVARLGARLAGGARWAVLGHSMGALLAYEIARRAPREGWAEPLHLFASGRRPPHVPGDSLLHDLDREALVARLRDLGGLPPEVAEHEELMDLMLPLLRADLRADETYAPPTEPPLSCPITALTGTSDDNVDREAASRWGELTTGPSRVVEIEGGHFFVQQAAGAVAETVARTLLPAR